MRKTIFKTIDGKMNIFFVRFMYWTDVKPSKVVVCA